MALVSTSHVSMHFGGPPLLEDLTLKVEPGARIGLIGQNGTGKSTLLKLMLGQLEPVSGSVTVGRDVRIAYQAQEMEVPPERSAYEAMRELFVEDLERERALASLSHRIATAADETERRPLLADYERLQRLQEARGSYDVDRRIQTVLTSLGLPESAWHQPAGAFSGGERNVIGLARVLLSEPDLMLLDEPSNHLDMEGVEWFIEFLERSPAAVLMVSHNRHLLDRAAREIWELRRTKVTTWPGNYGDFVRQKAEALALQERQYKVQQRTIERIEFQARRMKDMANAYDDPAQAKRAKAMLKRLDRMDKVERPDTAVRRFKGSLAGAARHGRIALAIEDFTFAHGERVLFDGASLEIEFGERVCLVGPNGSGKTTLFRQILEHGSWENARIRLGRSARVGEYRQLHDVLDADATLQDWIMAETGLDRPAGDALLHRFLFSRDDLTRRIGTLSGGEKSRLQLARLVQQKVNFLLLDEPTNHLDIESCEILESMLQDFDGTLLVISHDRYFLDKLVERVVEVRDRGLVDFRCGFGEWWAQASATARGRRGALEDRRETVADKEFARREFEERREQKRERNRLRNQLKTIEGEIQALEARHAALGRELEGAWQDGGDPRRGEALGRDFHAARDALDALYARWDEVALALEAAGGDDDAP